MATGARLARGALVGVVALAATTLVSAAPANAIVGGTVVSASDYPYFVRIHSNGYLCGASVVGDAWILTAAHCAAVATSPAQITAFVTGRGSFQAVQIVIHPLWNGDWADGHDLALVRLPAGATTGITPVQVGAPFDWGAYAANTEATIMGHGRTSANGPVSEDLRVADTPLRSDDYMDDIFNPWYWYDNWKEPLMIGAGSTGQTTCDGDSGGPLVVNRFGKIVQVGVFSFIWAGVFDDGCDTANGFAELSGSQLAWVATTLPSIVAGWGGCRSDTGSPGEPSVTFQTSSYPGAQRDGAYYWSIWCVGQPATVTVPSVVGESITGAGSRLGAVGLALGAVSAKEDRSCESINLVMSQSPRAGTVVPPASTVSVVVGQRPKTPCP